MTTDARFKGDLNSLQELPQPTQPEPQNRSRDPIPAGVGTGRRSDLGQEDNAGTIQSPLTEEDFAARTYHPTEAVIAISSDGLFTLEARGIKSIDFVDAADSAVTLEFAVPT